MSSTASNDRTHSLFPHSTESGRLAAVIDELDQGLVVCDASGRIDRINPAARQFFDIVGGVDDTVDLEDLAGRIELSGPDAQPLTLEQWPIRIALDGRKPAASDYCVVNVSSERRWIAQCTAAPVHDSRGQVMMAVMTLRDVTERRRQQRELKESRDWVATLLNTINDAFITLDRDWNLTFANRAAQQILGWGRAWAIGDSLWAIEPSIEGSEFERQFRKAMESREALTFEAFHPAAESWYECRCHPRAGGLSILFSDVTDRKTRELVLREKEQRFESAMVGVHAGFWEIRIDSEQPTTVPEQVYISSSQKRLLGYGNDELPQTRQAWRSHVLPADLERTRQAAQAHLSGRMPDYECEYRVRHRDGSIRWLLARGNVVRDDKGRPVQWTGINFDITERKHGEMLRAELAAVAESSDAAIIGCNPEGTIASWNRGAERIYGHRASDAIGRAYVMLLPDPEGDEARLLLERMRRGERMMNVETTRRRRNGRAIDVSLCISPVRDRNGELVALSIVEHDVTLQKRAGNALRESEARFRGIFDQAAVGIGQLSIEGEVELVNRRTCDMLGMKRIELIGMSISRLAHPDGRRDPRVDVRRLTSGEIQSCSREMRFISRASDPLWVNMTLSIVRDDQGRATNVIMIVQDVTLRKQTEEELTRALTELGELNDTLETRIRERTESLVHQQNLLRDLMAQLTVAEQSERRRLAADLHDYLPQLLVASKMKLARVRRTIRSPRATTLLAEVLETLDDSLKYTRTLVTDLSPTVLYEFGLSAAMPTLVEHVAQQGLRVEMHEEGQPVRLPEYHAAIVYQATRETLHNAAKHAGVGKARLDVVWTDEELSVEVSDQGRGFDPEEEHSRRGRLGKFGLFNIEERLESLGGRLEIASRPGSGTRVRMIVPLRDTHLSIEREAETAFPIPRLASAEASPEDPVRLLLADGGDSPLRRAIRRWEAVETVAELLDASELMPLVIRHRPEVVLLDVRLPGLDGLEATRQIKARCPNAVVIGLSSLPADADRATGMARAGAAAFIDRDMPSEELRRVVFEMTRPPQPGSTLAD